ncbi:MAG: hypothetical protein Q4P28_03640 [Tissierellia bacterium]|nr:hypothetical protein [Tissierellia bacterium]
MKNLRLTIFKELMKINLLYANPQLTSQTKTRMEKKHQDLGQLYRQILIRGFGLSTLLMVLIYGVFAWIFDFSKTPLIFDNYLLFFLIIGTIQVFVLFYNVMYDSKDLAHLMPLPVRSVEIYGAKLVTISLSASQMVFPMIIFVFKFFWDNGYALPLALLISMYSFFVINGIFILLNIFLMEVLARINVLKGFKQSLLALVNIGVSIAAIVFIMYMQQKVDYNPNMTEVIYGPLSKYLVHPRGILVTAILSLVILLLGMMIVYFLGKNYLQHFMKIQSSEPVRNKSKTTTISRSKGKVWTHYHKKLILDQTILMTSIFSPVMLLIFPNISIIGAIQEMGLDKVRDLASHISYIIPLVAMIISLYIAFFPGNLFSIIVSVENENYLYLKALPLNWKEYLNYKAKFCTMIYTIIIALFLGIIAFILKAHPIYIILAIAVSFTTLYSFGLFALRKDLKTIIIGWQNITEAYNRQPKWIMFLLIIAFMVLIGVTIGGSAVLMALDLDPLWFLGGFILFWILVDGGVYLYQQKKLNEISGGLNED